MREWKFSRKPQTLTFMERAPGSDAKPVKKMGSLEKVYLYQHCPSSVENLATRGAHQRPGGTSHSTPPVPLRGKGSLRVLDDVDGLAGVLDGDDETARVQDGVMVRPLQHPRPGVAPVVRDVDVRAHHRDGPPDAPWEGGEGMNGGGGHTHANTVSLSPPPAPVRLGTVGDDDADGVGLGEGSHGDVQLLGDAVGGVDVEAALQAREKSPSRSPWGPGTGGFTR